MRIATGLATMTRGARWMREAAARTAVRVPTFAAPMAVALALASASWSQIIVQPLSGRASPFGIRGLVSAMEYAGVTAPPLAVWECHGRYLASCYDAEDIVREAIQSVAGSGQRFESPEALRRAMAATSTLRQRIEAATAGMVACLKEHVPESEGPALDRLAAELRARAAMTNALQLWMTPASVPGVRPLDVTTLLAEVRLNDDEQARVRRIVVDAAARREQSGIALTTSSLANRMRMAQLAEACGAVGRTPEEANQHFIRAHIERMQTGADPVAGGANVAPGDQLTELVDLRSPSADVTLAALRVQSELVDAIAEVVSPEAARRLRRVFRQRCLGLESMFDAESWDSERPGTPSVLWTARRILTHPEVRGERRAEARRILAEWAEAEDAAKERMARLILARPSTPDRRPMNERQGFRPGERAIPEVAELAAPFQARLSELLEMSWIADPAEDAPAPPPLLEVPELSADELHLTGAIDTMRRREIRDPFARPARGWMGLRAIDAGDLVEWRSILPRDASITAPLDALVEAHRMEWAGRVGPLAAAAGEEPPRSQWIANAEGHGGAVRKGLDEWRTRAGEARPRVLPAAIEIDGRLIDGLRAALPEEEQWRIDVIAFHRAAGAFLGTELYQVADELGAVSDEWFGGRRVDPVNAVLLAGLPHDRRVASLRALAPALAPLSALIAEERSWLEAKSIEEVGRVEREPVGGDRGAETDAAVIAMQRHVLESHERWRRLEREALEAATTGLEAPEAARVERSARSLRFPRALEAVGTVGRISAELRESALEDPDVERGLHAITEIDRAETALVDQVERRAAPTLAEFGQPMREPLETASSLQSILFARLSRNSALAVPRRESERWAWYVAQVLPREVQARCPAFHRYAAMQGVLPPPAPAVSRP